MTSTMVSRVLARANRKKQKMTEEELNYIIMNTDLEKEKLESQYQNFLSIHSNGQMSKRAFNLMMKESYPGFKTKKLNRHVFRMYDTNGDGFVDFKELILALDVLDNGTPEQNLKQIFRVLDINNDGKIHVMELVEVLRDILDLAKQKYPDNSEDLDTLTGAAFAEMDLNADGEISEDEFVTACLERKKFSTIVTLHVIELFSG